MLRLPDEAVFVERTTPGGKKYYEHKLVDRVGEAAGNREIAALLLENGYKDDAAASAQPAQVVVEQAGRKHVQRYRLKGYV
jgi:hypothetical protein